MSDRKELLFKVLVIGDIAVGKTSIIKRYVHQIFSQNYKATIGVDFALKVIQFDDDTLVRLQLWDIAGQERFGNMTRVYYKEAVGAFVVFDATNPRTLEGVKKWKDDLDAKVLLPNGNNIPAVLLGNKCDELKDGTITNKSEMDDYCKGMGFAQWFATSAKENINVTEAANFLVKRILENDREYNPPEKDSDIIDVESMQVESGKSSCCRS